MELSDGALVEDCLAGRREAFTELVRRHQGRVFNLVHRMANDRSEAADITQDAFVRAYEKLRLYRPGGSFRNWVMAIAINLAKNRFRSQARRRQAETRHAALRESESEPAAAPDPRCEELDVALRELPPKWRVPLVLKYMEGLSYEEIASVLKIGVGAAKMRVLRGRSRLLAVVERTEHVAASEGASHGVPEADTA
jgi:RNA polymerase sigma-70 factor (ECF subfamily)